VNPIYKIQPSFETPLLSQELDVQLLAFVIGRSAGSQVNPQKSIYIERIEIHAQASV
jgi:hypothetical protein